MNYKLSYDFDAQLNCGVICFNDQTVLMDFKDLFSIINFDKNFIHYYCHDKDYPFYLRHQQKITYLEYLFKYNPENIEYIFKNDNKFDLRRENILIYHNFHKVITNKYDIIDFKLGHFSDIGIDAYIMKNPMWKIQENDKEYWLMYCEKDTIIKLCKKSLDQITDYENTNNEGCKITFYRHQNGYICSTTKLYIHQIITGCYGNGKGTLNVSVDHIDQDSLNNSWENLRIATRDEQEQNSKGIKAGTKRERKYNAQELPVGITQNMMKKYVVYYKDYADKEKTRLREYFRIESHPKLDKLWSTTKSCKITIQEKLTRANKVIDDLENDIYPDNEDDTLPKYVSLIFSRDKPHLVFEKIVDDKRLNIKMVLPEEYNLQEQLGRLNEKIVEKYGIKEKVNIFKYVICINIDDKIKYIKQITFSITREAVDRKHTLSFENFVTEKIAILEVEKWLSNKLTEKYFNEYKNYDCLEFNTYKDDSLRGILLGGGYFLDEIVKIGCGHITINCGS